MTDEAEGPRALVVDGDEATLRLLELKLSRAGFQTGTASDGEDGYLKARAFGPDVIIIGDTLGPLDSHSLVRAVAELPADPAMVFLSSRDGGEEIDRALRAGCDDYVLKPFSPHELIHRVRVVLSRRRIAAERNE